MPLLGYNNQINEEKAATNLQWNPYQAWCVQSRQTISNLNGNWEKINTCGWLLFLNPICNDMNVRDVLFLLECQKLMIIFPVEILLWRETEWNVRSIVLLQFASCQQWTKFYFDFSKQNSRRRKNVVNLKRLIERHAAHSVLCCVCAVFTCNHSYHHHTLLSGSQRQWWHGKQTNRHTHNNKKQNYDEKKKQTHKKPN